MFRKFTILLLLSFILHLNNHLFSKDKDYPKLLATNLIKNGDFSKGNIDFTSDYFYASSGFASGGYVITDNPKKHHPGFFPCLDHTNDDVRLMMVFDSYTVPNKVIWSQTVAVSENRVYDFRMWAAKLVYYDDSYLEIRINGEPLDSIFHVTHPSGTWSDFHRKWCSNGNTTAKIEIVNTTLNADGNDLAIDDISFIDLSPNLSPHIIGPQYACENEEFTLSLSSAVKSCRWFNGETTPTIRVKGPGKYYVEIFDDGSCTMIVTIEVISPEIDFAILQDIIKDTLCLNELVKLYPDRDFESYKWFNKKTNTKVSEEKEFYVKENGEYYLVVVDSNGCTYTSRRVVVVYSIDDNGAGSNLQFILNRDTLHYIDSTEYLSQHCSTIGLFNSSNNNIIIDDVYLFENIYFSTPLSQFPITIPAQDTVDLIVCFAPFKIGENRDTLQIKGNCRDYYAPLLSYGVLSSSNVGSKCDVSILLSDPESDGEASATFYNPTPNPASDFISVKYEINGKASLNIKIYSYIIDVLGNKVANSDILSQTSTKNNIANNSSIEFNVEKLKTGYYILIIEIENQIVSFPILINK